jgi:voltage-gated potassium channel
VTLNIHHRRAVIVLAVAAVLDTVLGTVFGISDGVGIASGIYFATATATTVGYGDITPHGWLPHVLAMLIMCTVIPLFASVFSLVTTGLTADHVDGKRSGGVQ